MAWRSVPGIHAGPPDGGRAGGGALAQGGHYHGQHSLHLAADTAQPTGHTYNMQGACTARVPAHLAGQLVGPLPDARGLPTKDVGDDHHSRARRLAAGRADNVRIQAAWSGELCRSCGGDSSSGEAAAGWAWDGAGAESVRIGCVAGLCGGVRAALRLTETERGVRACRCRCGTPAPARRI